MAVLILLFIGIYPYAVYPLLVWILGFVVRKPVRRDDALRTVTVVISAYNEEESIAETIRNKLDQDYPATHLNVLVVSDSSEDRTDEIVRNIAAGTDRVSFFRQSPRQGKTAALNTAVSQTDAEIIVFSDANSVYEPGAIKELVSRFGDPSVGYVTGCLQYAEGEAGAVSGGSGAFMRYENLLRTLETKIGSIVGVDGGIDAVRSCLYRDMRADQLPDFVLPLTVARAGYRVVYEPGAISNETSLSSARQEFRMRVRVTTRAFWALLEHADLLNVYRHGLFSWQLLSHKWLRYVSIVPLGLAWLLAAWSARDSALAATVALGGLLGIGLAGLAGVSPVLRERLSICRFCLYFLLLNVAQLFAMVNIVRGERFVTWRPRVG